MATALAGLAQEAKDLLGAGTKISYSADWTEYGAHSLPGGELRFPLDPLWASPAVDFIGLDAYWPLSDWRDGDEHAAEELLPEPVLGRGGQLVTQGQVAGQRDGLGP